jgi:hypothetical protein
MGRKGVRWGSWADGIWIVLCLASGQQADVRVTNFCLLRGVFNSQILDYCMNLNRNFFQLNIGIRLPF